MTQTDYLYATPYRIVQNRDMYHFSSDTELLGRFLLLNGNDRVLDVGTNNGALLCYAAVQQPAQLCGIDLFPEVIALAEENLKRNRIQADLSVSSLQLFQHDPFTVIVCNPPYFDSMPEKLKNQNPYLYAARHRDYLSIFELFRYGADLLERDGRICLVFPAEFAEDVYTAAGSNQFRLTRFCPVYDRQGGSCKRALFEFSRNENGIVKLLKPVYLDHLHDPEMKNDLLPVEQQDFD